MAENALGNYLRERREATTPEQVGLPRGDRRRTPGLRRAELATLSGVSVDYLTRLEQGRDHHPSAAVLAALADTLQLSAHERGLFMRLGVEAGSGELCPANAEPAQSVRPSLAALLDSLEPTAALVVNRIGDVLAHTSGWTTLFEAVGLTDDEHPNVVRHLFTDPRARAAFVPWERAADDAAATLMSDNPATTRTWPHCSPTWPSTTTERWRSASPPARRSARSPASSAWCTLWWVSCARWSSRSRSPTPSSG